VTDSITKINGSAAWFVLNRPDEMNALNKEMIDSLDSLGLPTLRFAVSQSPEPAGRFVQAQTLRQQLAIKLCRPAYLTLSIAWERYSPSFGIARSRSSRL